MLHADGITEVDVYPTAAAPRAANVIIAQDDGLGLSALAPGSNVQVPVVFGGDGVVKETAISSCGLAASATAIVQLIHRHSVWDTGGRVVAAREWSRPGAST